MENEQQKPKLCSKNPNKQQNPKRAAKTQTLPLKHGATSFWQKPSETRLQRESEAESEMEMSEAKRKRGAAGVEMKKIKVRWERE